MELKTIRKKLDNIDKKIVLLLAKRISFMPKIISAKQKGNIPRYDPKREKQVIEKAVNLGIENKLREVYVKDIFKMIIKESHHVQKKRKK